MFKVTVNHGQSVHTKCGQALMCEAWNLRGGHRPISNGPVGR